MTDVNSCTTKRKSSRDFQIILPRSRNKTEKIYSIHWKSFSGYLSSLPLTGSDSIHSTFPKLTWNMTKQTHRDVYLRQVIVKYHHHSQIIPNPVSVSVSSYPFMSKSTDQIYVPAHPVESFTSVLFICTGACPEPKKRQTH